MLLVVCAGLFAVGVSAENGDEASEQAVEGEEPAEASESSEGVAEGEASHDEGGEETVLGVDVESPLAVAAAVAVSLALAVGLWLRNRRWLALLTVVVAVVFAVFDSAEIFRQLDESNDGIAVLAAVIAVGHLGAAVAAGLSTRTPDSP